MSTEVLREWYQDAGSNKPVVTLMFCTETAFGACILRDGEMVTADDDHWAYRIMFAAGMLKTD